MPFHVQMYDGQSNHRHGVYAFDLTEDELERRILRPYREGVTIVTGWSDS